MHPNSYDLIELLEISREYESQRIDQLNCGNGCKWCDGFGIMSMYGGPGNEMIAPCLECSPKENLNDLLAVREKAERAYLRSEEKKLIAEHNARISK